MYLGKDEVLDIRKTDKLTPLGSEVFEVLFVSEREYVHRDIDKIREEQSKTLDERNKTTDEIEIKKLDDRMTTLQAREAEVDKMQDTASDVERKLYVTQRVLDKCQTEEINEAYDYSRRLAIVGEILALMTEWCVEKSELVPILQWIEQSFNDNVLKAVGKKFGKDISDLNMLDYHYAITESETN